MLISAIFSLIIGTLVLVYIVKTLYRAWFSKNGPKASFFSINRLFNFGLNKLLESKESNLKKAQKEFNKGNYKVSKNLIIKSLYLKNYAFVVTPDTLHKQHLKALETLLDFKKATTIDIIKSLENSFDELTNAHILHLQESKLKNKFKKSPDWANNAYQKKIGDIKGNINSLEKEILKQIDMFFERLNSNGGDNVTYH